MICYWLVKPKEQITPNHARVGIMGRIQVLSFDMDGTLTDLSFVNSVWLRGVPELYAQKNNISFEQALSKVKQEYDAVGKERLEWYDLGYWLKKFGLNTLPEQLLSLFAEKIKVFPDVPEALENLRKKGYRLIVVTNARREFVDLELNQTRIHACFERIFSSPSDFRLTKNGTTVFERVCATLSVCPANVVHVGDDPDFDVAVPRKLGITSYLLDRAGRKTGSYVVSNLEEFANKF